MNRLSTFTALIAMTSLLIAGCNENRTVMIRGQFDNASNSTVYLGKLSEEGEYYLDSVTTDDSGRFEFDYPIDSTDFYTVRTNDTNVVYLVLTKGDQLVITGDALRLESTCTVKGSADSELLRLISTTVNGLTDSLNEVYDSQREMDRAASDSLVGVLEQYSSDRMHAFCTGIVNRNMTSIVSISATEFLDRDSDIPLLEMLLDTLQKQFPGNTHVTDFAEKLSNMKRLRLGFPPPPIAVNTPEGKPLSLDAFKGKVLLIDFWASWCGPCRRENPDLVSIYKRFNGPNFEILGVSLDDNADSWKVAIEKDRLTWPQASELDGWDSQCAKDYLLQAIPYNVLLDEEGRVIGKGLRTDELEPAIIKALRKKS